MKHNYLSDKALKVSFLIISFLVIFFIIAPLARLVLFINPKTVSVIEQSSVLEAIFNSLSLSFICGLISIIVGVPFAYLLSKNFFKRFNKFVETISDIPISIPHTVAGIALLFIYGREGIIGSLSYKLFKFQITGTRIAITIAMLFVSLPYMVNAAKESFKSIDKELEKTAKMLGASEFNIFRDIYLPLSKSAIYSGFILVWARAISEFGAVVMLAYYPMTAPVKIYNAFNEMNLETSAAIAAYLLLICIGFFLTLRFLIKR
ncbi:ABC transporter permease subunit [Desulfurella sp.]|uniref:ABC transporter permease subunit n=1 Tax=Desulfurella sp. TaxID=1962857 RepID=UPI003D0E1C37